MEKYVASISSSGIEPNDAFFESFKIRNIYCIITMSTVEGKVIVYYGKGEGKTTASIGHAIRTLGHNKKVVILAFMKGRPTTGEYRFLKNIDNLQIHLCGAPVF